MSAIVWVPRDTSALSVGAQRIARAIQAEAERRGQAVRIRRNGSRGLYWLEPLIEVETSAGRIAYGPIAPEDVGSLFQAGFLAGGAHP
ncbi:MAG: formate dehydrogenase, partial [Parvularculaceae bacterium]|nr:formate dehydrogenase [Parvularculaceae bacterium]